MHKLIESFIGSWLDRLIACKKKNSLNASEITSVCLIFFFFWEKIKTHLLRSKKKKLHGRVVQSCPPPLFKRKKKNKNRLCLKSWRQDLKISLMKWPQIDFKVGTGFEGFWPEIKLCSRSVISASLGGCPGRLQGPKKCPLGKPWNFVSTRWRTTTTTTLHSYEAPPQVKRDKVPL